LQKGAPTPVRVIPLKAAVLLAQPIGGLEGR